MINEFNLDSSIRILNDLVDINSGSHNPNGILKCAHYLESLFESLDCQSESFFNKNDPTDLVALKFKKNSTAKYQCLLSIHMDTVFDLSSPFQYFKRESQNKASGPGVIDAKGGIVIAYNVLKWLCNSNYANTLGWTFIISTDEETGSYQSKELLISESKGKDFALVFEPALENGNIVSVRPASANITLTSKGQTAHAGRAFEKGVNAITALISFIEYLDLTYYEKNKHIINIGKIMGGNRENIVPDFANCELNVRFSQDEHLNKFCHHLKTKIDSFNATQKALLSIKIESIRPAKPLTDRSIHFYSLLNKAIENCELAIKTEPSFGVCDGNFIASTGIPVIDTLGPVGTGMHTSKETIFLDS